MNIENIDKTIDLIRECIARSDIDNTTKKGTPVFNMRIFAETNMHTCGTSACIGGYAFIGATGRLEATADEDMEDVAADYLGLDYEAADKLFYPDLTQAWDATPTQAIAVLEHLKTKGKVDWGVMFD
jgi:hypothetical protein